MHDCFLETNSFSQMCTLLQGLILSNPYHSIDEHKHKTSNAFQARGARHSAPRTLGMHASLIYLQPVGQ